jgi:3-(3-hydroxy-phenyl)propionate hydroxylase
VLADGAMHRGAVNAIPGLQIVDLAMTPELEGVLANWFRRNECSAALVRPDNYVFGVAASAGAAELVDEAAAMLGL